MHALKLILMRRIRAALPRLTTMVLAGIFAFTLPAGSAPGRALQRAVADPWSSTQLIEAAELARELAPMKPDSRPTIVYVGFRAL